MNVAFAADRRCVAKPRRYLFRLRSEGYVSPERPCSKLSNSLRAIAACRFSLVVNSTKQTGCALSYLQYDGFLPGNFDCLPGRVSEDGPRKRADIGDCAANRRREHPAPVGRGWNTHPGGTKRLAGTFLCVLENRADFVVRTLTTGRSMYV